MVQQRLSQKCIALSLLTAAALIVTASLWLQHHLLNEAASSDARGRGAAPGWAGIGGMGVGDNTLRVGRLDIEEQQRDALMTRAGQLGLRLQSIHARIFDALMEQQGAPIMANPSGSIGGAGIDRDDEPDDAAVAASAVRGDRGNINMPGEDRPASKLTIPSSFEKVFVSSESVPSSDRQAEPNTTLLPGARRHPILTYSEEERAPTSIRDMIRSYPYTKGDSTCDSDFGRSLIKRWRDSKQLVCKAPSYSFHEARPTVAGRKSSIDCFGIKQRHHSGPGDKLCVMSNVAVNLGLLGDDAFIQENIQSYQSSRHSGLAHPYLNFPRGFIRGACALQSTQNESMWIEEQMPGWNADWTVRAFESLIDQQQQHNTDTSGTSADKQSSGGDRVIECDAWVDENVIVVQRDTFAILFHASEDFVNAFLAMGVLDWSLNNTRILVTDMYPQGPYWDIWSEAFGTSQLPVLTVGDLRARYGRSIGRGGGGTVCFRSLAVGIYGPASPFTLHTRDTPCSASTLMRAYSDFVIRGLGLQPRTHYARKAPSNEVVVAYIDRRAPSRIFCDESRSIAPCSLWSDEADHRSIARRISNSDELIASLRSLEQESFPNGAAVKFRVIDYSTMPLKEQIAADLDVDVMIGSHGAGLMHSVFMRDRGRLVEIFPSVAAAGNKHYQNMAAWSGRRYFPAYPRRDASVNSGSSSSSSSREGDAGGDEAVNVADVLLIAKKAIVTMDLSAY